MPFQVTRGRYRCLAQLTNGPLLMRDHNSSPEAVPVRRVKAPVLAGMFNPVLPVRTIRNWQSARIIPYYKVGRSVLFNPDEVFAHLDKHTRISPTNEVGK